MTMAIDFGTCNTVLARWNTATRRVDTLHIDEIGRTYHYRAPGTTEERKSAVIPSLVHYGEGNALSIGAHVENAGLTSHRGTFRWVKLDILRNNNRARRINGDLITPRQAADDLISRALLSAGLQTDEDLVVTLPVEAFDHYVDWLQGAVLKTFRGKLHMLDEATACILGYDTHLREGEVYVVIDFGGGTLDVSVVKTHDLAIDTTRPCDVLGRAGEEIGGSLVDQWLLAELQESLKLSDQDMADVGAILLQRVEEAKVRLSGGEARVEVAQLNDVTQQLFTHAFSAEGLRRILDTGRPDLSGLSLYRLLARTVERALDVAQSKYGTHKSDVKAVFMAGGSSLLLGVVGVVSNLFPGCTVHCEDPFEAIARGACRYAGEDMNLTLVHEYCLRAWDPAKKEYVLVPVVPRGTRYPTQGPISTKYVKAACDGATWLGLVVVERSAMLRPQDVWEVVGGRLQRREAIQREDVSLREINPADREFIHADPPCTVGERRFIAGFGVDENRRLTLSLKDLHKGNRSYVQLSSGETLRLPLRDLPIVKL